MPTPEKINNSPEQYPRVLVAPLDWGLGHATRCIPIIKELANQRCEIIIAASGGQRVLLQAEFPGLRFVDLPGYGVKFGKDRRGTILRLAGSIPKILIRIKRERAWLKAFLSHQGLDLVISDNRYGLAVPDVVCVFITHQLLIKTPFGRRADRLLQRMNYRFIRRFSWCWVPDIMEGGGLAGELSHPEKMPVIPTRYIGWLSRFGREPAERPEGDRPGYLLALLSGPEPQRTLLEMQILRQAPACPCRIVLVRGLPGGSSPLISMPDGMVIHDHLPAADLERLIRRAAIVIARPGYSTLMDLARLGKSGVLVPTPGQTEQEYLGKRLAAMGWAVCVEQRELSLANAMVAARAFSFGEGKNEDPERLAPAIGEVLRLVMTS